MVRDAHSTAQSADTPQDEGPTAPAERILAAALACMERDGIESTGIRSIAREAGVNSAAINYYFRSKDNLIRLALERSLENAFGGTLSELDRLIAEGVPVRAAFARVMDDYIRNVRGFPRLAYAHLREALVNQRYDGDAVKGLNAFLDGLLQRLGPSASAERVEELRLLLVQAWGNLLLAAVLPQLFEPFLTLDFSDGEERARYTTRLLAPIEAWFAAGAAGG
jgi:AcrR family transcriptional regulator